MKNKYIIIFVSCFFYITSNAYSGTVEDKYYRAILKETFPSDKSKIAIKLAQMKTANARKNLEKLLNDSHYWNQEAAVAGLLLYKDYKTGKLLFEEMLDNHMIDDKIEVGIKKNISAYYQVLIDKYHINSKLENNYFKDKVKNEARERILVIISASQISKGETFLKEIISNTSSPDRKLAFQKLTKFYPNHNYQYVKARLNDHFFRVPALTYIVKYGKPSDLNIFLDIIKNKEQPKYRIPGYSAVNKWANPSQKTMIFVEALREKDETLVQGALLIFDNVKSQSIRRELCRIVKKGKYQKTRIPAAMRLTEYRDKEVVPYLIIALDEEFVHKEQKGIDIFLSIITFGITAIADHSFEKHRKSMFTYNKNKIANHLTSITKANHDTSYDKWFKWAIYNGYTIKGVNIIQYLFSGYKATRERAINSAIKLLGYENSRDFFSRNKTFKTDTDLSLTLARMLIEKGFMSEEKW